MSVIGQRHEGEPWQKLVENAYYVTGSEVTLVRCIYSYKL